MIVTYSAKWLPYLREISDNSFTYPTLNWQNIGQYTIKMHFTDDPVVSVNSKPTGFYAVSTLNPASVILLKLCVHPLYQGRGHGTDLLADVERFTLNLRRKLITLNVHEMNLCTIYWLQKRGYSALKVESKLYADGRDGYSFYKEIK